jgi:hypothetical protein
MVCELLLVRTTTYCQRRHAAAPRLLGACIGSGKSCIALMQVDNVCSPETPGFGQLDHMSNT